AAPERWMQLVAREMNVAETAFLYPFGQPTSEGATYQLRWFTPAVEVDLCGHATLASAHALWETRALSPEQIATFQTRSGPLTALRRDGGWIELDFPATPATATEAPAGLIDALSPGKPLDVKWIGRTRFDCFVEVESEAVVRSLAPDMAQLKKIGGRGVIVTARADRSGGGEFDFVSRFFAPQVGVDED